MKEGGKDGREKEGKEGKEGRLLFSKNLQKSGNVK